MLVDTLHITHYDLRFRRLFDDTVTSIAVGAHPIRFKALGPTLKSTFSVKLGFMNFPNVDTFP